MTQKHKEEAEPILQKDLRPPRFYIRYVIVAMCCAANTLNYINRTNWSIVILSMKNSFDWNMKTQQDILGAFYYGYFVTPMVGGWLVGKYGGFPVILSGVAISSLITLLSPFAARCGIGLLISSRIIDGFGQDHIVNWKELAMSAPVWAICIYCIGLDFGVYLLTSDIPIFFETILQFDVEMSGYLLCIAQIAFFLTTIFGGILADKLSNNTEISKTHLRKLFACGFLGIQSILLILIGYISYVWTAVILMIIAFGLYGICITIFCANGLDIAPNHSTLVIGIAFTFSGVTGFISPAVVGALTEIDNTMIQWRSVFWIAAGVQTVGLLHFLVFGSAEIQEWAKPADNSTETTSLLKTEVTDVETTID
ncbi:sialin-like [Antedon mediterranea]|uniref:sialin-like n=1 Tax=Antedon mediterranea TaxID=105859 RepID=UPI003AF699C2